jgi:hypothetical protein
MLNVPRRALRGETVLGCELPDNRVFDLISINLHLTLLLTRNDKVHITIACKIEQAPTLEQILRRLCVVRVFAEPLLANDSETNWVGTRGDGSVDFNVGFTYGVKPSLLLVGHKILNDAHIRHPLIFKFNPVIVIHF